MLAIEWELDREMNEEFTIEPERTLQTILRGDSVVSTLCKPRRLGSSPALKPAISSHKVWANNTRIATP